ncbi:PcfJ domain-containing protein [Deinococcus marmoris]|uniref:PcfJ domain-containing protein n=1 Tax=Deinococcus marmoris TaxID=249408 RepID=UPI0012DE327C|nr:PcfJ domain-containing protein [Deinococcus marmoris]
MEQQAALGRSVVQLELFPDPVHGFAGGLRLHAGPRSVLVGPLQAHQEPLRPWQQWDAGHLDRGLRALHAQILEDALDLPALLAPLEAADPEAPVPRTVQRRLRRMLGLRSLLELAACWQDAAGPGQEPVGWRGRPNRPTGVLLPWHAQGHPIRASHAWHLQDLRRWHWPRMDGDSWATVTARHLTVTALLQEDAHPAPPLAHDLRERLKQRADLAGGRRGHQQRVPPAVDQQADAFVLRVRVALGAVLEPALLAFIPEESRAAVLGARNGHDAMLRLLPGIAPGPVAALTASLREQWRGGGHICGEASRPAQLAGSVRIRRDAWTAARAGDAQPALCLAAEAAAGPLHALVPGLPQMNAGDTRLTGGLVGLALQEVCDLFSGVAALPAEQDLPVGDVSGLLTGRGQLRLGSQAPEGPAPDTAAGEQANEDPEAKGHAAVLALVPGLATAVRVFQALIGTHEHRRDHLKAQACAAAEIQEAELDEALSGEEAFVLTLEDQALDRVLSWSGGVWFIQVARHPQDLVTDGRLLAHCVGWGGYAQAVRAGSSRIVRVLARGAEEDTAAAVLTLELQSLHTGPGRQRWQLVQAKGLKNRRPSPDEAALLTLWAQEADVKLTAGGDISALGPAALQARLTRLATCWLPAVSPAPPPVSVADGVRQATAHLAASRAVWWTPAATRQHRESLRRVALLVGRAHQHIQAELTRLHGEGESRLVGRYDAGDLLTGTGLVELPADPRPLFETLEADGGPVGLRARRRLALFLRASLAADDHQETLELRRGQRPGELRLTFEGR